MVAARRRAAGRPRCLSAGGTRRLTRPCAPPLALLHLAARGCGSSCRAIAVRPRSSPSLRLARGPRPPRAGRGDGGAADACRARGRARSSGSRPARASAPGGPARRRRPALCGRALRSPGADAESYRLRVRGQEIRRPDLSRTGAGGVSGASIAVGAPAWHRVRRGPPGGRHRAVASHCRIELALFAALGGLGMVLWARLVADPPSTGRSARSRSPARWRRRCSAPRSTRRSEAGRTLAARDAIAGLSVVRSASRRMLARRASGASLRENLGSRWAGIEQARFPTTGPASGFATLLICAPALLGLAAALAFWRRRGGCALRLAALAVLVATYGVGSRSITPGHEPVWGSPCSSSRRHGSGSGRAGPRGAPSRWRSRSARACSRCRSPLASTPPAWWDYENWSWFGAESRSSSSGTTPTGRSIGRRGHHPDGRRTETGGYWKASVLDRFDGFTWKRAVEDDLMAGRARARRVAPGGRAADRHRDWV